MGVCCLLKRSNLYSVYQEEINRFFYDIAEPLLLQHRNVWSENLHGRTPTLNEFYRAFSLVSSRAFLVDAYHGLSMVPIADAYVLILMYILLMIDLVYQFQSHSGEPCSSRGESCFPI